MNRIAIWYIKIFGTGNIKQRTVLSIRQKTKIDISFFRITKATKKGTVRFPFFCMIVCLDYFQIKLKVSPFTPVVDWSDHIVMLLVVLDFANEPA